MIKIETLAKWFNYTTTTIAAVFVIMLIIQIKTVTPVGDDVIIDSLVKISLLLMITIGAGLSVVAAFICEIHKRLIALEDK